MITIPFIYFSILTFIFWKRRGFDSCTYISFLYALTTGASILITENQLLALGYKQQINSVNFIPTFFFCFLLTLFIIPIYHTNFSQLKSIEFKHYRFVYVVTYIYFAAFLMYTIFYFKDIIFVLSAGDEIVALRNDFYKGEAFTLTQYPKPIELVFIPLKVLANYSYIIIFIFFYSITFLKLPKKIYIMMICGSLVSIILGILSIDRSKTFYWIILSGLNFSIFYRFMNYQTRKTIIRIFLVIISLLSVYFISLTIARFGEKETGVEGGVMSYAGQSFLNFCYFWENYKSPEGITLKHLLPAFHHYILGNYNGAVDYQQQMTMLSGMECGVFYTHLGTFIISAGIAGPFIITFSYLIMYIGFIKKTNKQSIKFTTLCYFYILATIPTCGIILYQYTNFYMTISLLIVIILLKICKTSKS